MKKIAIVVPCYNEQEVLETTNKFLLEMFFSLVNKGKISKDSFILYVNDGSKDETWEIIKNLIGKNVRGLNLAGNVGHQNALFAGLMSVKDEIDLTISIDADLQDDINAIECMIDNYYKGDNIVFGVRNNRENDSFFKKVTAQGFYKFMKILGVCVVYNHADFRLMDKISLKALSQYGEVNLFLRAIVAKMGFKTSIIEYKRLKRMAGESKYPLKKMLSFAFEGITSFSTKLLSISIFFGIVSMFISLFFVFYTLFRYFNGEVVAGWSSIFISIWFLGGIQLFTIGILGKYIGKNYLETKKRPRYFVLEYLKEND